MPMINYISNPTTTKQLWLLPHLNHTHLPRLLRLLPFPSLLLITVTAGDATSLEGGGFPGCGRRLRMMEACLPPPHTARAGPAHIAVVIREDVGMRLVETYIPVPGTVEWEKKEKKWAGSYFIKPHPPLKEESWKLGWLKFNASAWNLSSNEIIIMLPRSF